jgi:hypothetical protein
MNKLDIVDGKCEMCGMIVHPQDLYVDVLLHAYSLVCQVCFYKRNSGKEKEYYERVKEIIPDVYTEKQFNEHRKDVTAIGDALVFTGEINDATMKNKIGNEMAKDYFTSPKISSKFFFETSQYSFQTIKTLDGGEAELLMLKAKVRFKSYLEFLEHELYLMLRKECNTIFD